MKNKTEMREYWSTQSEGYCQVNIEELETPYVRKTWEGLLKDNLPDDKRLKILEVGCGPGFLSILLSNMGHEVTAADFSENMLIQARRNAEHYAKHHNVAIDFRNMDAHNLEADDETFDVVISRNVT